MGIARTFVTQSLILGVDAVGLGIGMAARALDAMPLPSALKDEVLRRAEDAASVVVLGVVIIVAKIGLRDMRIRVESLERIAKEMAAVAEHLNAKHAAREA